MTDAVLFDIGNVLVRFDYQKAVDGLAAHCDLTPPEVRAVLDRWHGAHETGSLTSDGFVRQVMADTGCRATPEEFRRIFCDIFVLNEPMWDLAGKLKGRVPIHLFSNTSELHQNWLFEQFPCFHEFDGGFYSWKVGAMKPDAEFYTHAVNVLELAPERIGYIDDLLPNIETGERTGFVSFVYHPDRHADFLAAARERGLDW